MIDDAILEFTESVDPGATRFDGAPSSVPEHWQAYLAGDTAEATFAFRREMAMIRPYLPETADGLEAVVLDGGLVASPTYGLCRIVVRQIDGELYPAWSRQPTTFGDTRHAAAWAPLDQATPVQYSWIARNVMNGLTDLYGFGGPLNSGMVSTVARQIDTFAEAPWWDELTARYDPEALVLTFSSGGGAYLVYDTAQTVAEGGDAKALLLDVKTQTLSDPVSFLSYLDAWTAIGLAE